jgi:DNA-binding NarL/FixJ family response regulator
MVGGPWGTCSHMEQQYKVFLVEDSPAIRETLVSSVESSNRIRVVGFAEGADDAWSRLQESPVDAVLIDLRLSSGTGFDLLAKLRGREEMKNLVKIVLTNYGSNAFRQRCMALGADYFFDKSLEFDGVVDLLNKLAAEAPSARP